MEIVGICVTEEDMWTEKETKLKLEKICCQEYSPRVRQWESVIDEVEMEFWR